MDKEEEVLILNQPLLEEPATRNTPPEDLQGKSLRLRVWIETKKLWRIVGPAIVARLASFSMNVITQAFAGHLGDNELAAFSIVNNVILGFSFGLLLGMASALETLCGQSFGAKRYSMLGIYLQRSWIVLFICCILITPVFIFASPILKLLGQTDEVSELSGIVSLWVLPLHFSYAFIFPLQRFLQSQLKNFVTLWMSLVVLVVHALISWIFVYVLDFGLVGAVVALDISWWLSVFMMLGYVTCGWCPLSWPGLSLEAFSGLWEFVKLSTASGVMLCLEFWYYRILIVMTGNLSDATIAVDALSICMTVNGWEFMIHLAFLAGVGVRVANELGAGNGQAAKFASKVAVAESSFISLFFCALIVALHDKFAYIFTSSADVLQAVDQLSYLLAVTILLNGIQPVISGIAIGSGWQAWVAYINLFCYYIVGLPLGIVLGFVADYDVLGMWSGMVLGGTLVQTVILAIITTRRDWENEALTAGRRVKKWSRPDNQEEGQQ
ncbi:PREDICTED: protein TRANSPARENT TESTA 12-like [Fragaria vesca subsp. vesca]|uniref:protein TRANSPARENT TESTA 12-like n=1 Tax=Fragaria vesca subsp. vesca TaxID=101020 RepID=UPI0002C33C01|nr:PREDICTED: protein TRANSPARENT TESTA 12-like [Fragaria vesca subsp. vesca]